jgi:hypothetical protein
VVGVTSNREELNEIENIVKVFVVTQRIITLANDIKSEDNDKNNLEPIKKSNINPNPYNKHLKSLTVKGLN